MYTTELMNPATANLLFIVLLELALLLVMVGVFLWLKGHKELREWAEAWHPKPKTPDGSLEPEESIFFKRELEHIKRDVDGTVYRTYPEDLAGKTVAPMAGWKSVLKPKKRRALGKTFKQTRRAILKKKK